MAEQSSGDKTEKPSAQKLRKAREQGQVARSRDVATAIGILVSLKLVILMIPSYLQDFRHLFWLSFPTLDAEGAFDNAWSNIFTGTMLLLAKMILPLFIVPLAVVLGSMFPGGWAINATHLMPKLDKLNPIPNLQRLFSAKHFSDFTVSLFKALALCGVLFHVCSAAIVDYVRLQEMTLDRALLHGADLMINGLMALCMVFVLFAFLDMPIQRFLFMRGQRMSKQEVKEEYKTTEGRPEVRQRIRQLQMQIARRSLNKTVPEADVVIVNPEHYAVALKYDEARAEAPFLVAKGVDEMALYIRQLAGKHAIEVVELPPLARAIYNTSHINQQIPASLYKAVAHVLTYVLQLKAFQTGRRAAAPQLPNDLAIPAHLT